MRPTGLSTRSFLLLLLLLLAGLGVPSHGQILPVPVPPPSPVPVPPPSPVPVPLPSLVNLAKLDPLLQQVATAAGGRAQVIVQASSSGALGAVAPLVQLAGGTLGRQLSILDAQVAV